jgi:hypothetical protein
MPRLGIDADGDVLRFRGSAAVLVLKPADDVPAVGRRQQTELPRQNGF